MNKLFLSSMLFAAIMLNGQEWNINNKFQNWKVLRNAKGELSQEAFVLSEVKKDPQIIISPVSIDPAKFNSVTYTYKATGAKPRAGQLYFASANERFSARKFWVLPRIISDGKYHTVTLKIDTLSNSKAWFEGGIVTSLRFDITDSAATNIEIKELKFTFIPEKKK